jgi:hypothetical protein
MTNRGVAPYDPDTGVGVLRVTIGDTMFIELAPPEVGYGDYELFSDEELEQFIDIGNDNNLRAAGFSYMSLAGKAALEAKMVKDYDLQVDLKSRSIQLRETAAEFFRQADAEEIREGLGDPLTITRTGLYEPQEGWLP